VTFQDAQVRAALARDDIVKVDVDDEAQRALRERYFPNGGVPVFVIVDRDGEVTAEWVGGGEPASFLETLAAPPARAPREPLPEGAALGETIARAIEVFARPAPGGFLERVGLRKTKQTIEEWDAERNEALDTLTRIGEPAVPALIRAMEQGTYEQRERCAVVRGRIRSTGALERILALLRHPHPATRAAAADALGGYRRKADVARLLERLGARDEPVLVKRACAGALSGIAASNPDIDDPRVAEALIAAARSCADTYTRFDCLKALMSIPARYDLALLAPLLRDRRSAFADYSVGDCAGWVFGLRAAHRVEGTDEPPDADFLLAWWAREKARLMWNAERGCYVPAE
jgi:hypothetical protein